MLRERYGETLPVVAAAVRDGRDMASIMSSTIVNVAIPDMSHYFTLGQERAQWVTSGFMVATTVSMLTTPWLLSRYGYRATYVGPCCSCWLAVSGADWPVTLAWCWLRAWPRAWQRALVQPSPPSSSFTHSSPTSRAAPAAFWHGVVLAPPWAPALAACWWTGLAGARFFHGGATVPGIALAGL